MYVQYYPYSIYALHFMRASFRAAQPVSCSYIRQYDSGSFAKLTIWLITCTHTGGIYVYTVHIYNIYKAL